MATPEDQARFEQAQSDYTFGRPARAVAESLGIPTTGDDALRMAAGPRVAIAQYLAGLRGMGGPSNPTILDEPRSGPPPVRVGPAPDQSGSWPTRETPTVPAAAANAPVSPRFPVPEFSDEYLTDAQREVLRAKVPGNYAPLIADNQPPPEGWQRDAWRKANGFPTQAELQAKIDSYAAQEGAGARIADNGQPAYQFLAPDAVPPVRSNVQGFGKPGVVGPQTHQEMLESPIFGDAYRASLAAGEPPFPTEKPAPVQAPVPVSDAELEARRLGKPGVGVPLEDADRWIAAEEAKVAAREAAAIPRATRMKSLFKGAASEFLDAVPVADAIITPALAAGALAGLEVQDSTPAGVLRDTSNRILQKPLEMPQVGASADYLRANPHIARQLYQEGVLSTDAFMTIMDPALQDQPSLEPMAQAMRRIGG